MDHDLEYSHMINSTHSLERKHKDKFCRQRWCLVLILAAVAILSCAMSAFTALLYFNMKDPKQTTPDIDTNHRETYRRFTAPGGNVTNPAAAAYAHKVLSLDFPKLAKAQTAVTLQIDPYNNHNAYEIAKGVKLQENGLEISLPGTYFVYKSIYFTPESRKECGRLHTQVFTSRLKQKSSFQSGGTTTLLETIHSCCPSCRDNSETAFSGGIFYLEQGDVIQVEVCGPDLIDVMKDVTYVGLMKLGSLQ